ncbi:MAG TPA: alkaline phosphatase family protein [Abditibacteriaceae bacterium]|jgi:predicted AlkP superfamily pyrophosphatase or phosphodiesterase
MKRRSFLGLALLALPLLGGRAHAAPRADHVFIISFDGGKPSVMQKSPMPLTMEMAKTGATTWNAQTIFPSITLVSHTSMLTGVQPAKHKIMWNEWIPQNGMVKVPTVFKVARDNGYTTALFAGKAKFRHLNVAGTLDEFQIPSYNSKVVAAAAAKYIVEKKPNVCFIHFADSDGAGHAHGWGSAEQVQSFADEDAALQIVRDAVKAAGIEKRSTFILSADHGGHDKTHGSNSPEDMTIPWIAWGAGVKPETTITDAVTTFDTAATALWLLDVAVPADWDGKPVTSAFK